MVTLKIILKMILFEKKLNWMFFKVHCKIKIITTVHCPVMLKFYVHLHFRYQLTMLSEKLLNQQKHRLNFYRNMTN